MTNKEFEMAQDYDSREQEGCTADSLSVCEMMDAAAAQAAKSFPTAGTAQDVAKWLKKHYMEAGSARLSKIILYKYGL